MKKKSLTLWAALRLHRILTRANRGESPDWMTSLSLLLDQQRTMERCWRLYRTAMSHGWTHSAELLSIRLQWHITQINSASRTTRPPGTVDPTATDVPGVADILAEIRYLTDEFSEVEILPKEGRIDVTTDEITLEDVCLGRFAIQLHFDVFSQRRDASAFTIFAKDPNPASSDNTCTHPHVRGERLCAGDARGPISYALAEGRIGDAFQLVNRVLHTYNRASPYVALGDWDGQPCSDCGRSTSSDGAYCCNHCDQEYCDNCIRSCDRCDASICLGCAGSNDDGERLCPKCKELDDKKREEANEEEAEETEDDPVHDPAPEQPQPQTETSHAHSHFRDISDPQPVGPAGGTTDGEAGAGTAGVSDAQAA